MMKKLSLSGCSSSVTYQGYSSPFPVGALAPGITLGNEQRCGDLVNWYQRHRQATEEDDSPTTDTAQRPATEVTGRR